MVVNKLKNSCFLFIHIIFIITVDAAYDQKLIEQYMQNVNQSVREYEVLLENIKLELFTAADKQHQGVLIKQLHDSYAKLKLVFFSLAQVMPPDNEQLSFSLLKANPLRIAVEHFDKDFIVAIMSQNNRWINQFKVRCINDILFGKPLYYNCLLINEQSIEEIFKSLINSIIATNRCYPHEVHATLLPYIQGLNALCEQDNQKEYFSIQLKNSYLK